MSDNNNSQLPKPSGIGGGGGGGGGGGLKLPTKIARSSIATGMSSTSSSKLSNSVSNSTINNENETESSSSSNHDSVKVGDRVWLNGTKPGVVAFLGETQFKEGVWAGVILDSHEGKNNGSLNGVVYFVTEENRGVFCRPTKLTKTPMSESEAAVLAAQKEAAGAVGAALNTQTSTVVQQQESLVQSAPSSSGLKVGDRVAINNTTGGLKLGTLRYIGETEFAKGEWAGVELDERIGKNDGCVGTKRYFQCESLFGVFAPVGKVELFNAKIHSMSSAASTVNSPQQSKTLLSSTASKLNSTLSRASATTTSKLATAGPGLKKSTIGSSGTSLNRHGSQESLVSEKSSIYSTSSAAIKRQSVTTKPGITTKTVIFCSFIKKFDSI